MPRDRRPRGRGRLDPASAAALLGVSPDADPRAVRRAFRAAVRAAHPDTATGDRGPDVGLLVEARRRLLDGVGAPPPSPAPPGPRRTPVDGRVDGDTLVVDADPATVMAALLDVGHDLGDVTYLDRSSGLVEIMVHLRAEDDATAVPFACSVVASLQGRAHGVEVFCTVERLDGGPRPPIVPLVAALAEEMGIGVPAPG